MKFLSAEWRKLAIINYEIHPEILEKYIPKGVELDFLDGKCLVSLVGFMFVNTRLCGVSVPFYKNFEEVNLRFYVKKWEDGIWKRGVVFIKEIVPKKALSFIANSFYNEHYEALAMSHKISVTNEISVEYSWENQFQNRIKISAHKDLHDMQQGSDFEFITEHYFGYTKNGHSTTEYEVRHPKWQFYEVKNFTINVDFEANYGKEFAILNHASPDSVMLAEGSEIEVHTKRKI